MKARPILDLVSPLNLSGRRPSLHPYSDQARRMLSPDIDLMESVLGIMWQGSKIHHLYAHSVRVEQMSISTLGNSNYQLYKEVLDIIRYETPNRWVRTSDRFFVPIYRIYVIIYTAGSGWVISPMGDRGEVFPEAVRSRRSRAVEETLRRLRENLEDKLQNMAWSLRHLLETPVFVFDKPPLSKDAEAVMVETVWRTLKQKFPNEVTLAELAV
jgi:hypothetical protein